MFDVSFFFLGDTETNSSAIFEKKERALYVYFSSC